MFWTVFQVVRLLMGVAAFIPVTYLGLLFVYAAIRSANVESLYYLFFAALFLGLAYVIFRGGRILLQSLAENRSSTNAK